MKEIFYLLPLLALVSCREKTPSMADYMHRALLSDTYKIALVDVKRVKDSLALETKHPIDTTVVIYEYNMTNVFSIKCFFFFVEMHDLFFKGETYF